MASSENVLIIGLGIIALFAGLFYLIYYGTATDQLYKVPATNFIHPRDIIRPTTPLPIEEPIVAPPIPPPIPPPPPPKEFTFLIMGQSNFCNYGETRMATKNGKVFNNKTFYDGVSDPVMGMDGTMGSVWSRLLDTIDPQKFSITLIPTAVGGTAIARWRPSAKDLFENVIKQVTDYKSLGKEVTHVLWHQGESDRLSTPPNTYRDAFIEIANALQPLTNNAKIYVAQASYCFGTAKQEILDIQEYLGNLYYRGPNTDTLGSSFRYDNCHFNAEGLVQHAALWKTSLGL